VSVSVFVMPLSTWLSGRFRPSWGPDGEGGEAAGPQRSPEDVRRGLEALEACVERALGKRPEWDESGPARLAMVFSVDGFFAPFLEARRRSYRQKLPLLSTLEPPQIWIPQEFDVALPFPAPWNPPADWTVASAPRLQVELRRLLGAIEEDERPDLEETRRVGTRLLEMAALGVTHAVPVIIEV
jgi:hypothetical protein